jgi:glutamine amidotransferase-like uncharacterized protein
MRYLFLFGALALSNALAESKGRALVYKGPGSCTEGCSEAAADIARSLDLQVIFVGEQETSDFVFRDADVWIQPGGQSREALRAMNEQLKSNIKTFVAQGGAYVGFCAGMFVASEWIDKEEPYAGLGLIKGSTKLFLEPGPPNKGFVVSATSALAKTRQFYFEGGPYWILNKNSGPASVVTWRYANGAIAGLQSLYGSGRVTVIGTHPEAPQAWRDFYQLKDDDGLDFNVAQSMLRWALKIEKLEKK